MEDTTDKQRYCTQDAIEFKIYQQIVDNHFKP